MHRLNQEQRKDEVGYGPFILFLTTRTLVALYIAPTFISTTKELIGLLFETVVVSSVL